MSTFKDQRIPKFGFTSADPTSDIPADALITGSMNLMYRGQNELEAVGGFERTLYGGVRNFGGDLSMIVGKGFAVIGDVLGEASGNIIEFVGRSLWFTGVGDIRIYNPGITATPQALGNSPLQNNIPQVCVVNEQKNGYSSPFQMGLLKQIEAPQLLIAATGVQNKLNGTYSLVATWLRDATGAESLPSPPSNIAQFSNQTGILQLPAPTNPTNPRDRWRIYCTPSGFGAIGGYFFFIEVPERRVLTEAGAGYAVESGTGFNVFRLNPTVTGFFSSEQIGKRLIFRDVSNVILHTATVTSVTTNTFTVKGVTYGDKITFSPAYSGSLTNTTHNWSIDSFITALRQINIEWFDNELGAETPPTDFFPPSSTALFVGALGNVTMLIGTEDGSGVAVSAPNFPEAFPPDFRMNLSEPPVGVLSRPQDGFLFVLSENSVTELRRVSSDISPVAPRVVADQVGAASQRGACMAGNSIYLFTKSKLPARILPDGSVDTSFGNRVEGVMKTWTANQVSLSFDERKGFVAYCHGSTMLLYYPAFDYWATPVSILDIATNGRPIGDGVTRSAFTMSGVVHSSFYEVRNIPEVDASFGTNLVTGGALDFSELDIGKWIRIPGAGIAGAEYFGLITNYALPANLTVTPTIGTTVVNATATIEAFQLFTFDRDQNNIDLEYDSSWVARFAFGDYGSGLMPKTVTKAVVGMKSEITSHTLRFFRNYNLSSAMGADRTFTGSLGNHINNIVDCNNGEGQFISVELSGNESRSKIYFIEVQGFASGIETNYGA